MAFDLLVRGRHPPRRHASPTSASPATASPPSAASTPRPAASSTPPATSSRRPSSTRTSTWTRRSPTACRGSTPPARCSKASRSGASCARIATVEEMRDRALAYCDWAVSMGLLAIRSHVDTTDDRLLGVEALLEVRRLVAPYLDLQLVAFPQDGLFRAPNGLANLTRALDMGVDVVGGIPHFERTMEEGARARCATLPSSPPTRGLMLDLHCDETDDPLSRHIETLAAETRRLGLGGRVAGSHLTSMHSMDNYYVSKLLPLIAEAGVAAIPNPLINIVLQGRHDTYPKRRGLTRVKEMRAHGITGRLGPGLRARPLVLARHRRHARRRLHGPARRADDQPRRHARLLRHGDRGQRPHHEPRRLRPPRRRPREPRRPRRRRPGRGAPPARRPALRRLARHASSPNVPAPTPASPSPAARRTVSRRHPPLSAPLRDLRGREQATTGEEKGRRLRGKKDEDRWRKGRRHRGKKVDKLLTFQHVYQCFQYVRKCPHPSRAYPRTASLRAGRPGAPFSRAIPSPQRGRRPRRPGAGAA